MNTCWSFHGIRLLVATWRCLKLFPGRSPTSGVSTVASRPLPDESSTVLPPSSSKRYDSTLPPPGDVMSDWIRSWGRATSKMLKSSTRPSSSGSPYCERPSQLLFVFPMLLGLSVMLVLVATGTPLTHSVPVVPDLVTATWLHVLTGSGPGPLICCSPPPPVVVMANRSGVPVTPARGVRNMLTVVPVPKSKARDQFCVPVGFTHMAIVKSVRPFRIPAGMFTVRFGSAPLSLIALPKPAWPAERVPTAGWSGGVFAGPSSHSTLSTAFLMLSASSVVLAALTWSPISAYASDDAFAPAYRNELSVRSSLPAANRKETASASLPVRNPTVYSMRKLWSESYFAS